LALGYNLILVADEVQFLKTPISLLL
jgi:hypothetical protein